jgi:hypothetical protein
MDEMMFKNAVLAILKARPGIGSIQLRKALIIADAAHHALHGESITGARYIKHPFGPVPDDEAFAVLMKMDFPLHQIEIIEEPVGHLTQNAYYAVAAPDYSIFTRNQIDILNYAAVTAYKYGASRLSDMTHDAIYHQTPMGAEIPLDLVCTMTVSGYDTDPFTDAEKSAVEEFLKSDEARLYDFV